MIERRVPRRRGRWDANSDPLTAGVLLLAGERFFLLHVDPVVGASLFAGFHPRGVFGVAGDDDERGARLLADDGLRQPLLTGPLDEHRGVVADAAVEQ